MKRIVVALNIFLILAFIIANLLFNEWKFNLVQDSFIGEFQTQKIVNNIQVVNTGTSHGSVSFDWKNNDRVIVINLGRSGQPPFWDKFLLNFYENHFTNTLIVLPISFHTLCMDDKYDPIESIYNSKTPFLGIGATQYSIDLVRIASSDKAFPSDEFNFERFSKNTIIPSSCDQEIINKNLSYLDEIIQSFDKVVLVTTPYYIPSLADLNSFDWFYKTIELLSDVNNVNYYDYSRDLRFNNENYFYNSDHLNTLGREKFTNIFIDEIVINYLD